jgi:acyl transferase domain-containing protein
VQALCTEAAFLSFSKAGMLSPDGRCKTFDGRANGYVRGEGCGAVMAKLEESGDVILGKIIGRAINQDGRSNGLTAPNGPSQVKLIQEAMEMAGVKAREVSMLEAHGTGTSLGDPIEVQAVAEALGRGRKSMGEGLLMGSAKTNFGHCETAAGVLGVLKTVLCLGKGVVAQHLHFKELNGFIGTSLIEGMGCVIPLENVSWKRGRRTACVSSFGFSGTNAHVIIRGGQRLKRDSIWPTFLPFVFVRSRTDTSVTNLAFKYADWLVESAFSMKALAVTSVSGRCSTLPVSYNVHGISKKVILIYLK